MQGSRDIGLRRLGKIRLTPAGFISIKRFRCTTSHHLRWGKLTSGPISRAKKCPKKRGDALFKRENLSSLKPPLVLNFIMCLKNHFVVDLVLKKINIVEKFSSETAREVTHVAVAVPT